MLKNFFSSDGRIKILTLFLTNPHNRYYIREIEKITALPVQAIQREVANLFESGLLTKRKEGNRCYYQVDTGFSLFPELKNMILKTTAHGDNPQK